MSQNRAHKPSPTGTRRSRAAETLSAQDAWSLLVGAAMLAAVLYSALQSQNEPTAAAFVETRSPATLPSQSPQALLRPHGTIPSPPVSALR